VPVLSKEDRLALAEKRLCNVLRNHVVANARTLEQKISDAGPHNQRIDPHVLTVARRALTARGIVRAIPGKHCDWFHLSDSSPADVNRRLEEQQEIHQRISEHQFTTRMGQTLEIAVFKALQSQPMNFFGSFRDLQQHDDSTIYSKVEPPEFVSGLPVAGGVLDFLIVSPEAGPAGLEVKNVREWLYPDRGEVRDLLVKCCSIAAVPVLIARRIPFVTFRLLNACGVAMHETFNQRFPFADRDLAAAVANKHLLGYHDVRVGNEPDPRLLTFVTKNLPRVLVSSRSRFNKTRDLLAAYGSAEINYPAFAEKVKLS